MSGPGLGGEGLRQLTAWWRGFSVGVAALSPPEPRGGACRPGPSAQRRGLHWVRGGRWS